MDDKLTPPPSPLPVNEEGELEIIDSRVTSYYEVMSQIEKEEVVGVVLSFIHYTDEYVDRFFSIDFGWVPCNYSYKKIEDLRLSDWIYAEAICTIHLKREGYGPYSLIRKGMI